MDIKELQALAQENSYEPSIGYTQEPKRFYYARHIDEIPHTLRGVDYRDIWRIFVAQRDEAIICGLFNGTPATLFEQQNLKVDFWVNETGVDVKSSPYRLDKEHPSGMDPDLIVWDMQHGKQDYSRGQGNLLIYVIYTRRDFFDWVELPLDRVRDKANWMVSERFNALICDLRSE